VFGALSTSVIYNMQTFDETSRRQWDSMEAEWECEKQKLLTGLVDSADESLGFLQESDVSYCIRCKLLN